jgi:hypothetical protein
MKVTGQKFSLSCLASLLLVPFVGAHENGVGALRRRWHKNKKCPKPSKETICTFEYRPVTCNGCSYPNSCIAAAALGDLTTASCDSKPREKPPTKSPTYSPTTAPVCPLPPPGTICTFEYEPLTCNGCPYSNGCIATAALAGQPELMCLGSPMVIDENGPVYGEIGLSNRQDCPLPEANAPCTFDFVPLKCDGCIYINSCTATSAKVSNCVNAAP